MSGIASLTMHNLDFVMFEIGPQFVLLAAIDQKLILLSNESSEVKITTLHNLCLISIQIIKKIHNCNMNNILSTIKTSDKMVPAVLSAHVTKIFYITTVNL